MMKYYFEHTHTCIPEYLKIYSVVDCRNWHGDLVSDGYLIGEEQRWLCESVTWVISASVAFNIAKLIPWLIVCSRVACSKHKVYNRWSPLPSHCIRLLASWFSATSRFLLLSLSHHNPILVSVLLLFFNLPHSFAVFWIYIKWLQHCAQNMVWWLLVSGFAHIV